MSRSAISRALFRSRRLPAVLAVSAVVAGLAVATAAPAAAATSNPTPYAGARHNATNLKFGISGTAALAVDVATGNGLFSDQLITLPGIGQDVPVALYYNSSVYGTTTPSAVTGAAGSGWSITGFDERMVTNSDSSVTFYGPGGLSGVFTASGSTFTTPPQFRATLAGTKAAGYTLTEHVSHEVLTFNPAGRLVSDKDRDGNVTKFAYDGYGQPASITSTRGPTSARTLTIATSGGHITMLTQTNGYSSRVITLGWSSGGHLASVTDSVGGVTSFASAYGTDTGQVVTITNPLGKSTSLAFTSAKISQVTQANPPIDNGAGSSVTRLTYPTSAQTLVADPTTNQSQSVAAVPHTTYNLTTDGSYLVKSAIDPDGNQRSATYTTLGEVQTATPASGGATTFTYGANSGESLTKVAAPTGATQSAAYTGSGASAYLPSSTTDDSSNSLVDTYDSNGNQLGSQQGTSGPTAKVTYNGNGTVATSASPGAGTGITTKYTYDSSVDLTTITPPTGTSLGNRTYTWDSYGRLATATDGKGGTLTYTYDNLDRLTKIAYSDGTPAVSYTYDKNGHVTKRVDGSGTTTYTYDDLGALLSTTNSANGNTVAYTYDLAGALASTTDGMGAVTYVYDAAHLLTEMTYPQGESTETTYFANDANGRRTDVWMQSNSAHTAWAAHEHFGYDTAGRINAVKSEYGPATSPTVLHNETVCYSAGAVAPSCPATSTADRANIQWTTDSVTGETNTYTYDTSSRLTKDAVSGGSDPRTYTYTYDSAGNRTSAKVTGSSPSTQTLTYNNGNQVSTSGYTYDGAGDLITSPHRTATFNAAGQQTSATVSGAATTYKYAGATQNELLSEVIGGGKTYTYTYGRADGNGNPIIDRVDVSGNGTGYMMTDPSGEPIMVRTVTGNTDLYQYDAMGNVVDLSTSFDALAVGLTYDPYGNATRTDDRGDDGGWLTNPYGFAKGMQDRATGETKFGRRSYSALTGGWTQQDELNAPLSPQTANRYQYAASDPVNAADPTGRFSITDLIEECAKGALEGLVVGLFTGEDETGVGAVEAAVKGCGVSGVANILEQEGYEELGQEVEAYDDANSIAEIIEAVLG